MHRLNDRAVSTSREAGAENPRTSRIDEMSRAIRTSPEFRAALVERIRSEIQRGTYETTWRLNAATDRMVDRLGA